MLQEERLDAQIDRLLNERRPDSPLDEDEAELLAVVRAVKGLRHPAKRARRWMGLAAVAAVAAAVIFGTIFLPLGGRASVVQAMEQTISQISSYHAVIEHRFEGPNPGQVEVRTEEVWYQGDKYAWRNPEGEEIISDGEREWKINHYSRVVDYSFPLAPKLHPFQPANLLKAVRNQPYTIVAHEQVAGRPATRVSFAVPQLKSYEMWIDTETKLPLQIEMHYWAGTVAIMSYKTFELNLTIPADRFAFKHPDGYSRADIGARVASLEEAERRTGIKPVKLNESPSIVVLAGNTIYMGFGDVLVTQGPENYLIPDQRRAYGWSGEGPVWSHGDQWFTWNQGGVGFNVRGGDRAVDIVRQILPDLSLPYEPYRNPYLVSLIEEPVQVDMEAAMAAEIEHARAPRAHADRALPIPVAQRFVAQSAQVPDSAFLVAGNNGGEAIVTVAEGPISKVYLRRVARQDEQGLWWVIGFDRR